MLISEKILTIKKSKFYGYFYSISSIEEAKKIISSIEKENKKATHICLAYVLNNEIKFKNDREVGSPGRVLLSLLEKKELKNHLLIVVRYFGGVKLGIGGVQRAFREVGKECLKK